MSTTDTLTASSIKAAAADYNSDYPEAAAEIEAGTTLRIFADYADNFGRRVRMIVEYGVRAADGGWIGAGEPDAQIFRSLDGRIGPDDQARRRFARLIRDSAVPVEIRRGR